MRLRGLVDPSRVRGAASEEMRLLLLRWAELETLFVEASASADVSFHVQRVASINCSLYFTTVFFDAWLNWVSFCKLSGANPLCPPPGLLPDWLRSQASNKAFQPCSLKRWLGSARWPVCPC